jgi:hypothetical protein
MSKLKHRKFCKGLNIDGFVKSHEFNYDGLVKSRKFAFVVIPAKAGIQ